MSFANFPLVYAFGNSEQSELGIKALQHRRCHWAQCTLNMLVDSLLHHTESMFT